MHRLYIFDMGGVMCEQVDVAPLIAGKLGIRMDAFLKLADEEFDRLKIGALSVREFWERVSAGLRRPVPVEYLGELFRPGCSSEMRDLVLALKRSGARAVVGSDTIEPHYQVHLRLGHYDVFDALYLSCRIGVAKPDPEFYRRILRSEGRRPEETVFIDDREPNVAAAANLGIRAIHFQGSEDLRRRIVEIEGGEL